MMHPWPVTRSLLSSLALAGTAVACGGSLLPGGGATDLSRPWQAEPFAVAQELVTEAVTACRSSGLGLGRGEELVVVDARGDGTLTLVFAGPNSISSCDLEARTVGAPLVANGGSTMEGGLAPAPEPDELVSFGTSGFGGPNGPHSSVMGRAGVAIVSVRVATPRGLDLAASIGPGGWYSAWWPTDEMTVEIRGIDANGNVVATTQ